LNSLAEWVQKGLKRLRIVLMDRAKRDETTRVLDTLRIGVAGSVVDSRDRWRMVEEEGNGAIARGRETDQERPVKKSKAPSGYLLSLLRKKALRSLVGEP
jgi:hypothetical protein